MISENKLKEAYINQILSIFNDKDQDFYEIAKQLKLYNNDQVGAEQEFNNLALIDKLKKLKNRLMEIDSIRDLLNLSLNFTKNSKSAKSEPDHLRYQQTADYGGSSFLGFISSMFKFIFNPQQGGFLYSLMAMVDNLSVSLNPEVNLLSKETKISEHSDLFVEAAKIDPSFNRIYRDFIGKNFTDQQILHEFFKSIKTTRVNLNNQQRHRLFVLAEKKILKNNVSLADSVDGIVERVTTNLTNAATILRVNADTSMNLELIEAKITTVASVVRSLVKKIGEQEKILQLYINNHLKQPKAKEQKLEIYNYIQHNKQKLYHFLLKTEAWCNGETLSKEKPFDFTYIYNQFSKFPASIQPEVGSEEPGRANSWVAKSIFKLFKNSNAVEGELQNQESFKHTALNCTQELLHEIITIKAEREAEVKEFSEYLKLQEDSFQKNLDSLEKLYAQAINHFNLNNSLGQINIQRGLHREFNPIILKIGELNKKIAVLKNMQTYLDNDVKELDKQINKLKDSTFLSVSGVTNISAISSEEAKKLFEDYNSGYNSAKLIIETLKVKINRYQQHLDDNVLKDNSNIRVHSPGMASAGDRGASSFEGFSPSRAPQPA